MSDLLYSIGLDITDLKTSARAANEQAAEIKRGFKGFKDVIEFGGVGAAVVGFFKSVIDYAENLKGPLDDNTAAVKRFGAGLDEAKQASLGLGAQLLGWVNRAGEAFGTLFLFARDGVAVTIANEERAAAVEKTLVEIAEVRKKTEAEHKKITEELVGLDRERDRLALEGLTTQEKINVAIEQVKLARAAEAESTGDALAKRKLHLETQRQEVGLLKEFGALDKENAEKKKKTDDDATKAADKHIELADKLLKLRFEALADEEKVAVLVTERAGIEEAILKFKKAGVDTLAADVALLENGNALAKARKELTEKQVEEEKRVTEEKRKQAAFAELERAAKPIIGTATRTGADFANAGDDALEEIVRRNRQRARDLRNPAVVGGPVSYIERVEAGRLEQEANNAEGELRLRQGVRSSFSRGGAGQVYSDFSNLDPTVLDRLISQFAQQQTAATQSARNLQDINDRLKNLFG